MKKTVLLSVLYFLGVMNSVHAYDFMVENAEGVKMYYNVIDDGKNVAVTYYSSTGSCYQAPEIIVPSSVTYEGKTYTVTEIGQHAFESSEGNITLPNSVTTIRDGAFFHAQNGTIHLGNNITTFGDAAFAACFLKLGHVRFPNNCSIGKGTFSQCYYLEGISFEGNATIGSGAFSSCNLINISFPDNLTKIEDDLFDACDKLTDVIIPAHITDIGNKAFRGCIKLTGVLLSEELVNIGDYAFYRCKSLKSITIPDKVNRIGEYSFSECDSLAGVSIGNGVTTIGESAFSRNTQLEKLTIGSRVKTIGDDAFSGCSDLKEIHNYNPTPQNITTDFRRIIITYYDPFGNIFKRDTIWETDKNVCKLYVPQGSLAQYRTAVVWKEFLNIIGDGTAISPLQSENHIYLSGNTLFVNTPAQETVSVYSLMGKLLYIRQKEAGEFHFNMAATKENKIIIVRGSSGWTKKFIW